MYVLVHITYTTKMYLFSFKYVIKNTRYLKYKKKKKLIKTINYMHNFTLKLQYR